MIQSLAFDSEKRTLCESYPLRVLLLKKFLFIETNKNETFPAALPPQARFSLPLPTGPSPPPLTIYAALLYEHLAGVDELWKLELPPALLQKIIANIHVHVHVNASGGGGTAGGRPLPPPVPASFSELEAFAVLQAGVSLREAQGAGPRGGATGPEVAGKGKENKGKGAGVGGKPATPRQGGGECFALLWFFVLVSVVKKWAMHHLLAAFD